MSYRVSIREAKSLEGNEYHDRGTIMIEADSEEEAKDKAFAILCPWIGSDFASGLGYYWKAEIIQ